MVLPVSEFVWLLAGAMEPAGVTGLVSVTWQVSKVSRSFKTL